MLCVCGIEKEEGRKQRMCLSESRMSDGALEMELDCVIQTCLYFDCGPL